jgi:hypothetical protein
MIESSTEDNLVILIDGGHTEYSPIETYQKPTLEVIAIGMQNDLDEDIEENFDLAMKLAESPNNWLTPGDRDDASWTTLLRLSGSIYAHSTSFTLTAATLMPSLDPTGYRPGGDDDYFDYYPSGLRMLREWALDLEEATKGVNYYKAPGFLGVYHNVLRDFLHREKHRDTVIDITQPWYEQEEVTERIDELARDLNVSRETIINSIH